MPRYVDAEEVKWNVLGVLHCEYATTEEDRALSAIEDTPTADVEPIVHAHWERKAYFPDGTPAWVCSRCGHPEEVKYSHCNCGARMDEAVKDDD